jgi:uncharacterized metal-binding protein YceD (DUF177 family)
MLSFCANELFYKKNNQVVFEINQEIDLYDSKKSFVQGNVNFTLKDNFILSKGTFSSKVTLLCDRCCNSFEKDLIFNVDESIEVLNKKSIYPKELELTLENTFEQVFHTQKVDVIDYIRQFIILNIPYKNLCSENCKNDKIISLDLEENKLIDPRWEKLLLYESKLKESK